MHDKRQEKTSVNNNRRGFFHFLKVTMVMFVFFTLALSAISAQKVTLAKDGEAISDSKRFSGLVAHLKERSKSLTNASDLDDLIEAADSKKLVLLGESTHGTSEYYSWRAEISKRLIAEKGFSFVAVEGDWASIYKLNAYVKGLPGSGNSAREVMKSFERWPVWMWSNAETEELIEWMRKHNDKLPEKEKVGFYGMDVYGQWEAMDELLAYAESELPEKLTNIKTGLECFTAFGKDEWRYARAVNEGRESCEEALEEVVNILLDRNDLKDSDPKGFFNAKQNALVVKNAEDFFRLAVRGGSASWNSRVNHMNKTINRLLQFHGNGAKGIVWAHNTHIGDSRATSMHQHGMFNIGNLTRNDHGRNNVLLIGFTTFTGRVMAGSEWGSRPQVMKIPHAMAGSLEHIFNQVNHTQFYLIFTEEDRVNPHFQQPIPHRAIGVTYDPRNEQGNYVPTLLAERYDAIIYFRETKAVTPLK